MKKPWLWPENCLIPTAWPPRLDFSTWVHQLVQDRLAVREHAEAAIAISTKHEFVFWLLTGMILRGWAMTAGNEVEDGIAQMRQGLRGLPGDGSGHPAALLPRPDGAGVRRHGSRGRSAWLAGQGGGCSAEKRRALVGGRTLPAEGELALNQPASQAPEADRDQVAEEYFDKALRTAISQGAKSLELRASMSLSRLRRRQGKEAKRQLAEVYGWFTEGFETADLCEARTLLESDERLHVAKAINGLSSARGGQILVSSRLHDLTANAGDLHFAPISGKELKGLAGTHQLFEVLW